MTVDFKMGGAEWLGTEIVVDGRGSLWLDPLSPLTMLYGRNGAGKSTILRAIKGLARGEHVPGVQARAYFRLVSGQALDIERVLFRTVAGTWRTSAPQRCEAQWQMERSGETPVQLRGLFETELPANSVSPFELAALPRVFSDAMTTMGSVFDEEASLDIDETDELTRTWGAAVAAAPFGLPFWFVGTINGAAAGQVFKRSGPFEQYEKTATMFGLNLAEFGITKESWDSRTWNPYAHHEEWTSLCGYWTLAALDDLRWLLEYGNVEGCDEDATDGRTFLPLINTPEGEFFLRTRETIRSACLLGVVAVSASGTREVPQWRLHPALDLEPDGVVAKMHSIDSEASRWFAQSLCRARELGYDEVLERDGDNALWLWMDDGEWLPTSYDITRRFVVLPIGQDIPLSIFPIHLIDLDDDFDVEDGLGAALASTLADCHGGSVLLSGNEPTVDLPGIELAQRRVADAGARLARLDLGIKAVRLRIEPGITSWLAGRALAVEAHDATTDKWVRVGALSEAQRHWLRRVLILEASSLLRKPKLIVSDEPETGIHPRAVVAVFDFLSQLSDHVLAATHHPRALANGKASVLHITRTAAGDIESLPPMLGGDLETAAERFGVTHADLLGVKRLMVVVEGAHDRLIIEKLLQLSSRGGVVERCLIAEARGVRNVATVADSVILCQFTDMHVFVTCDHTRATRINELITGTLEAMANGATPKAAANRSEVRAFRDGLEPEERWVMDLVERATVQGILDRVRIGGISTPDIADLLPSEAFGLTDDWPILRDEHAQAIRQRKPRPSFKEWLLEAKKVRISESSITRAFDAQQAFHPELLALLAEIEIRVDVAAL